MDWTCETERYWTQKVHSRTIIDPAVINPSRDVPQVSHHRVGGGRGTDRVYRIYLPTYLPTLWCHTSRMHTSRMRMNCQILHRLLWMQRIDSLSGGIQVGWDPIVDALYLPIFDRCPRDVSDQRCCWSVGQWWTCMVDREVFLICDRYWQCWPTKNGEEESH